MMKLFDIRGKKANINRWEALKMLDWEKDHDIIEYIFSVTNPLFFSKRTPQEVIDYIRERMDFNKKMKESKEKDTKKITGGTGK